MSEDKRLFYPRKSRPQVVEYSHEEPIRGQIVFKGDFTPKSLTVGRYAEGGERVPDYVELDGRRYTDDGIDLTEHYREGKCVAVDLDGARYARERECTLTRTYEGNPCSDWTCSECGKVHTEHNMARTASYCPRCGARVTKVVMEPWNPAAASPEMRDG